MEGNTSTCRRKKVSIARSLVIPRKGKTFVRVANFTDQVINLTPDLVLGQFSPLNDVNVSTMDDGAVNPNCSVITSEENDSSYTKEEVSSFRMSLNYNSDKISEEQESKFLSLMDEYSDITATSNSDLGKTDLVEHEINTGDAQPVKQALRRLPPHKRETINQQIDDLLETDRIASSQSPWSSPVVLVHKKDGTYRMCVDYRKLNQSTVKDAQPLPRTDDALEAIHGAHWFSCIDLASGYWQVPVAKKDRAKTAFVTHRGQFEWKVMPFGLTNAPGTFQRLMNMALQGLTWIHIVLSISMIL